MSASDSVFGRVEKPHERERTSRRINLMKISPIKEMELLGSEYSGSVSLGQGTPSFATPDHIREAAIQAIRDGLTDKYSLGPGIRSSPGGDFCQVAKQQWYRVRSRL